MPALFAAPRRAFVRPVPASFGDALRADPVPLDVERARVQHAAYVAALRAAGVEVVELAAADGLPDSVFVEDPVLALGQAVVRLRPGAPSRRPEGAGLVEAVAGNGPVYELDDPHATVDGGDVMRAGEHLLVGRSRRTSGAGAASLGRIAATVGLTLVEVAVDRGLHLKSAVTVAAPGLAVVDPGALSPAAIAAVGLEVLEVDEPLGANVLCLGAVTLVSAAAPRTAAALRARGVRVVELVLDELHKADGALTCCSVRLADPGTWCC